MSDEESPLAVIVRGETPVVRVYEDDHVLAFRSQDPLATIHVIVVPKRPHRSLVQFTLQASLMEVASFHRALVEVPQLVGMAMTGYRLVVNQGDHASPTPESESRFHVHLLGGRPLGPMVEPVPEAEAEAPPIEDPLAGMELLLLLPTEQEPSAEQIAALAKCLDKEAYDVARLFPAALPRCLHCGPAAEVQELMLRLKEEGFSLDSKGAGPILMDFDPWRVDGLEVGRDSLVFLGPHGRFSMPADQEALLVRGRYAWQAVVEKKGTKKMTSLGSLSSSSTRVAKAKRTQFLHLYLPNCPQPFSFVESQLLDWTFLGEEMTPSARTNFEKLVGLISRGPNVTMDDQLVAHQLTVKVTGESYWVGSRQFESPSPDPAADQVSRVLYYMNYPTGSQKLFFRTGKMATPSSDQPAEAGKPADASTSAD